MLIVALSAAVGAALFGTAGWLGHRIAARWYADLMPASDGPPPLAVPGWVFVVVAACVGTAVGVHGPSPVDAAILLLAVLSLSVCAATDVRVGMIPDLFTLGPLALTLALAGLRHEWSPLLGAGFAFVPFAALALVSRGRGMGWGDVKLAALGGALIGMAGITLAAGAASLVVVLLSVARRQRREPIAFGPYLAASIGASLGFGSWI
ncbi:MAG: A24 family peptidase [Vulcanimicrobiaceae bacterium]|jgi:leader peptidase (prepilin peptidase)/N-methyltransferase